MASGARVTLRGRFRPGTVVRLVEVAGEHVLRSEGGREVDVKKVDADGCVSFVSEVRDGARYFVVGLLDGSPLEVRARGRAAGDDSAVLGQAPVSPDRVRLSNGQWADEVPEFVEPPGGEAAPGPAQHQVPGDVVQRSSTPLGSAHPVDTGEPVPYRAQSDVKKGVVQMSSTARGAASELAVGPQRQEDVGEGVLQRSSTPSGSSTVIPSGSAVEVQRVKEGSAGKEMRGEPGRVAAEPIDDVSPVKGASEKQSAKRYSRVLKEAVEASRMVASADQPGDERLDRSGLDAMGQPAGADVAAAADVEPAAGPREAVREKPAAKPAAQSPTRKRARGRTSTTASKE